MEREGRGRGEGCGPGMICLNCGEFFDPKKYGWKEKLARKMALSGSQASFMGVTFQNPFVNMLPERAKSWCNKCLREYLNLDDQEFDVKSLSLKAKKKELSDEEKGSSSNS